MNQPLPSRSMPFAAVLLSAALLFTGCVSHRYQKARQDTPPPGLLNVTLARTPVEAGLTTLITYNGPGSWKRDAFWDEYVISLRNPGSQPLTISSLALVDFAGTSRPPGLNPLALERESKTLEQKYKDAGLAFVRYTAPGVLIVGTGLGAVVGVGVFSSTAATLATATVVALPLYYLAVFSINQHNRADMEKEFHRRRLVPPLTLAPGESRIGSLYFPMVLNPRALHLQWSDGTTGGEAVLSLDFLSGLHLQTPATPAAPGLSASKGG